jgi:selenium metabolism protein YedF
MVKTVDNRGLACPQPVLNTRRTVEEIQGSDLVLVSIVDNEGAKENILRLLNSLGNLAAEVEKKDDGIYIRITQSLSSGKIKESPGEEKDLFLDCGVGKGQQVLMITQSTLGSGSEELGKILMRSFLATLKEGSVLPKKLLFLNSGVHLAVSGSPVLDDLVQLEGLGVEILSCGTCLDYYNLKDKLAVGNVTNMFDTVESLLSASKCITI